jgi:hypothetical protein
VLDRALSDLGGAHGELRHQEIFHDGHAPERSRDLECSPKPAHSHFVGAKAIDPFTRQQNRAAGRAVVAADQVYECGLARAVGSNQPADLRPVESEAAVKAYADALPRAAITLCRLHAGANELTRRIMLRGHGGSWPQPGDPLAGQPTAYLLRVAASAAAEAEALEHAVTGALRVDTDGLTVEETADLIAARILSSRG